MRVVRLALSAVVVTAALVPTAASATGGCKPYFHQEQVGPVTVTTVDVVC